MKASRAMFVFVLLLTAACGRGGYGQTKEAVIGALEGAAAEGLSLSGQQVNEYEVFINCTSFERIHELTNKWPAILGLELMFIIENPSYREHFMRRAMDHAARGGIVAVTWHARNPLRVCPRGEFYKCSQAAMGDEELERILEAGTREHGLWEHDVDVIAEVLSELDQHGIAPIFRPYHEMNGGWFWWGQKERYADLWRLLHRRLTDHHSLENLVWVWSPDKASEDAATYFPSEDAVDLVGADIYANDRNAGMFEQAKENVAPLHASGLFSFTEIGKLPSPEIFSRVRPTYFLLWGGEFINADWSAEPCAGCNRAEDVAAIYAMPEVVTLDELQWPQSARVKYIAHMREQKPAVSCPSALVDNNGAPSHE